MTRAAEERVIHQCLKAGETLIEQLTPADVDSSAGLVASQLSRGGKNRLYRKTLPLFRELLA